MTDHQQLQFTSGERRHRGADEMAITDPSTGAVLAIGRAAYFDWSRITPLSARSCCCAGLTKSGRAARRS